MERYKNLGGTSSVIAYEVKDDAIEVQFQSKMIYVYDSASTGQEDVRHMITLARAGKGLGSFIGIHVKKRYASKRSGI